MTGIYSFPKQRYFWSGDTRFESISSVMSRDRFLGIKKYLRVTDNSVQKISKEEKLSIDEQIIPFKGKIGGKSGICYDFIFYTGKNDKKKHGFCTDIVLDLCETVPRFINHKVYFDNYFTTIRLQ
ncbi:unnamed protein product, partial [Rotaria sordida]